MWHSFQLTPIQWYAFALAVLFFCPIAFRILRFILTVVLKILREWEDLRGLRSFGMHVLRILRSPALPMVEIVCVSIYLSANIFILVWGLTGRKDLMARSGRLSAINLVPLMVGTNLNATADLLGMSLRRQLAMHRWVGVMTLLLGMLHFAFTIHAWKWTLVSIWGVAVSKLRD